MVDDVATKMLNVTRQSVAATLATAIISSSGRTHSVDEALAVFNDLFWTLYPAPKNEKYLQWQGDKIGRETRDADAAAGP